MKKSATIDQFVGKAKKVLSSELYARARKQPIRSGTVLYESFSGNGMLCNPEAIFRSLLDHPDFLHLKHIWVLSSLDDYATTVREYSDNRRVRFVRYGSTEYFEALATSEYLFNNATFPWQFSKRPGQTYVNTWHGTPLKKMGYDVENGGPDTRNILRNFVQADFLVSANSFMTKQMYLHGYKLANLYRGAILEAGYPRIDRQNLSYSERSRLFQKLSQHGIHDDGREIILYAPTWKGESFYEPSNDAAALHRTIVELEKLIDPTRYRVLLKIHQVVYKAAVENADLFGYLVPNDVPTNAVLGLTDILVTDYSSIFYDFLATGRPVLFHIPDLNRYEADRGLYTEPGELPGPVSTTVDELAAAVQQYGDATSNTSNEVTQRYAAACERYVSREDGESTARLIDVVFHGRSDRGDLLTDHRDGRERVLIYLGGMASNGITTSVLNLLDSIDYDRFDVSALYSYSRNAAKAANANQVNKNVRLFPRQGYPNVGFKERQKYRAMLKEGIPRDLDFVNSSQPIWDDEWYRCFGDSEFDYIVDFSGYGPFWTYLLLRGKAKQHSVWLHNDLKSDAEREINGKRPLKANLEAVFSTYKHFDKLVSVSGELSRLNQEHLSEYAPAGKFTSAVNTVNGKKINIMTSPVYQPVDALASVEDILVGTDLPDLVVSLRSKFNAADIATEASRQAWLEEFFPPDFTGKTFVSVGRLSPEKNHARLIEAFSRIHLANPDTRLLLIGNGPLLRELESVAAGFGVSEAVAFAGQQRNPYGLMAAADCFVMSSDYEGQPMVILEAKILGLPIVTTAFGSVASAVPPGTGLVVERSAKALARGMQDFLDGKVPASKFDLESYNNDAIEKFYAAIGAGSNPDGKRSSAAGSETMRTPAG